MKKSKKIILIILGVVLFLIIAVIIIGFILARSSYNPNRTTLFGVTFSKKFALHLGLDWKEVYLATLDDLKVKYIRIPTYWEEIEPAKDVYEFTDIDWMVSEADKRGAKLIMVVGRRQPRWPECHDPNWVYYESNENIRKEILQNIEIVVNRYKNNNAIEMWQVENEPFLDFFGRCPHMTKKELQEEIDLVKSLDSRKILITDSGELSIWYPAIKMGDLFGTTLYRVTYNKYFGYWRYFFIPANFYRAKAAFWQKPLELTYVVELQAEPWFPNGPLETPFEDQFRSMDAEQIVKNAEYAKKTNFARAYFWGIEWWYWIKIKYNDNSLWEAARPYFK